MIIVIDANILFSALIKDSLTAEIIFDEKLQLFTCEFILEEFHKYEKEIMRKTSRTKMEFIQIMHQLKDIIAIVPKEKYFEFIKEAEIISPDKKDAIYFALAMKLNAAIWSNDKLLKNQDKIKVYATNELIKLI